MSNQKLFSVGSFDFRLQHLLIIGILSLSFSISILTRGVPLTYGTELFEYDTFFNYRATEYLLENSYEEYLQWNDEKSWHPFGRNVSDTSQVALHVIAATLYQFFGFGMSLYTFTVFFPLVIGSLTSIVVFAFVRVLGGTTAGLLASLMCAVSVPIIARGFVGWFKSEPLGLFLGLIALYLFVSAIKYNKGKTSILKITGAGLFMALSISSWGGMIFFILAIMLFYFAIPFFKTEKNFSIWIIPIFSITFAVFSLMFERTSSLITGYLGMALLLTTSFVVISEIIKKFSSESKKMRNCIMFLGLIISSSIVIFSIVQTRHVGESLIGWISLPSFRYQNAIYPLLKTQDALTDSVAEHATTNLSYSFGMLSVFIIFGVIGIWFLFSKRSSIHVKNDMKVFSLIFALGAIYLSSAFIRLELFASVALLILGGIGISLLIKKVFSSQNSIVKYIFTIGLVCLFAFPIILPEGNNWSSWSNFSPTILNGGTHYYTMTSDDWIIAMNWLKENTPKDAVVAAWWDYGYWITTLSDRTTIIDNSTLIDWQIKKMAHAFLASPNDAWNILNSDYNTKITSSLTPEFLDGEIFSKGITSLDDSPDCITPKNNLPGNPTNYCMPILRGLDADYILTFVSISKIAAPGLEIDLYTMEAGGDESKKHWFADIGHRQIGDYVLPDGVTPTEHMMKNTALGQLIPYDIVAYVHPITGVTSQQYTHGSIPIWQKNIKLVDPDNDPFFLVYASPGFYSEIAQPENVILIYRINPNYQI